MATTVQCKAAIRVHGDELMRLPNVVGLGIIPSSVAQDELVVAVYVSSALPESEASPSDRVPDVLVIPGVEQDVCVETRVIAIGDIVVEPD